MKVRFTQSPQGAADTEFICGSFVITVADGMLTTVVGPEREQVFDYHPDLKVWMQSTTRAGYATIEVEA